MDIEQWLAFGLVLLLCLSFLYEFVRGYRLCQRSGFRFYLSAAVVNILALLLPLGVFVILIIVEAGSHWQWFVAGMLALVMLSAADWVQNHGSTAARRSQPDKWKRWEHDLRNMHFTDRLLLRYPAETQE